MLDAQFLKETEERIDGLKGSKTDDFEIKEILGARPLSVPRYDRGPSALRHRLIYIIVPLCRYGLFRQGAPRAAQGD